MKATYRVSGPVPGFKVFAITGNLRESTAADLAKCFLEKWRDAVNEADFIKPVSPRPRPKTITISIRL